MAIIGKIREKSSLTLILLGVAMLAFIMGGWESMFGASNAVVGLGEVAGETIDPIKYENAVNAMVQNDQQQYAQSQREYTANDQKMSADRAWTMLVEETILNKEYEALGIDVSKTELDAFLYGTDGFTVMPDLAESFKDSITGQFNPRLLERRISEMESSTDPKVTASWENNKKSLTEQRKNEKYFQLLSQGVYVTKLEAEEDYKAQKEVKSISYVVKRYYEIPDTDIKVSDEDIRNFYDAHKNEKKYEATAGRDVRFFDIKIVPSKKDSSAFNKTMNTLKSQFAQSTNDSLFVLTNSDFKFYTSTNQATLRPESDSKARNGFKFPAAMDTVFKTAAIGQIVGPYLDNGKYRLAKVRGFNTNVCKVRHILLSAPKGDSLKIKATQRKADSLVKLITKDNFVDYVNQYSEDPGSKATGGVYEDFMDYEMVPEFSKFSVEKPIGTIGTVKTDFGIHIIEVLDRKAVKYPIASVIEKELKPSSETETAATDEAYNILYALDEKISRKNSKLSKIESFDTLAKQKGYFVRPINILDENPKAQGIVTPFAEDRILKLAYDANSEVGTLCSSPIKDEDRYIIAIVSSIREKGVPQFDDIKERLRAEVIKEKKAERIIKQFGKSTNLDALAAKSKTTVTKAEVVFANAQIQGGGYEPEIVGSLFSALRDGQTTKPMKGEQGVYVIRLNKTLKAPAVADYLVESSQMLNSFKSNQQGEIKNALIKLSDVKDNRRFAALGIRR
jgi:peptidyl-prolyl cis-trans isomerase D